ncbi:antibiotic biosynthesis monooxygenase [Sphaerisporangium sp. TRM90804]|uniref:antibiotic biosynthesis monooxygenase n=1 Tax=Sphaerisporangium sp. TRM90804 TaxID=3031113 RepID=UPI00244C9698|nr:antibiotic biosynthesis monooxygenase [Sphaerisporangium sp. TRM90804]MDH2426788.1 hypothetical protein [Sphaerisporangium sp. TRM90804]
MEALVAVTAFAGALFAAITTGILVGRLRDERSGWLVAWTITTTAVCLALGAVAIGHLIGFGPATFRVYQITGAFLAPFWLAIGMVQMLAEKTPAKFAAWLFGIAFTVITAVILVLDPVSQPDRFGKALPLGETHWTIIPSMLLNAAHGVTYLILIGCLIVAVLRWRGGDDFDADNMHAGVVLAPTGLALVGAVRFAIPGVFAALVITLMAGAVWYAVARPLAPYDEERDGADDDWDEEPRQAAGRRRAPEPEPEPARSPDTGPMPVAPAKPPQRRSGLGDLVAEYRAADHGDVDYAARMQPSGGFEGAPVRDDPFGDRGMDVFRERGADPSHGPGDRRVAGGSPATGDHGFDSSRNFVSPRDVDPARAGEAAAFNSFAGPATGEFIAPDVAGGPAPQAASGFFGADPAGYGAPGSRGQHAQPSYDDYGRTGQHGRQGPPGDDPSGYGARNGVPGLDRGYGAGDAGPGYAGRDSLPGLDRPGYGQEPGVDPLGYGAQNGAHRAPAEQPFTMPATGALFRGADLTRAMAHEAPQPASGSVRPSPSIYGLLTVFTLMDGAGEAFDRLAEETIEAVRRSEPDTLVFICHAVKSAPLQRIVYELYRDEVAYTEHQRQAHMERFARERVAHVLAANVIELNVNAAKVVPLPTAFL